MKMKKKIDGFGATPLRSQKKITMQLTGLRGRAGSKNNLLDSNSYYPSRPPRPPLRVNVSRAGNNGGDVTWGAIIR